jgi:hypothetical protein
MNMGAVAALRRVKNAISVARHILEHTQHSMLVGDQATQFAVSMGFKEETLETKKSREMWHQWKENNCQPNFWVVCKITWICINLYRINIKKCNYVLHYISVSSNRIERFSIPNTKSPH